ncbi:putative LPS assembly protein LptD [Chitinophaga sp. Cy-1792]|uniref:putative LPS assembly protein LptD n=1 Tax=Chitinophaga sp. Cy-1792 TaxID=2608339 RepID=UPI001421DF60|nr:putative LPS assembly protein LptD [Chitinophaga sp. Cy-1792]NIG57739.1 LPS-assembly protein LptD [Chitinophaga sp. Cy-1792]
MSSSYKNNYKKFLRQTYLVIAGVIIAVPFIIDATAGIKPHAFFGFNKIFADTVPPKSKNAGPIKPVTAPLTLKDTAIVPKSGDSGAIKLAGDSTFRDSTRITVDTFKLPVASKDSLDATVTAKAQDSMVLMIKEKQFYLYGNANVKYKTVDLTASKVAFDQNSGVMSATQTKDTAGKFIGRPVMNDGGQSFESDTVEYNFMSQKAMIFNTKSVYGEGYVHSEKTKRMADNTIFGFKNGYTTCDLDTPHFSFRAKKIKVIPDKLIVSGPANLEIQGIPTPLFIPFAIFPITQGQRSGLLPPQFVVNQQKGMGLENGGYYFGMGEHLDLTVRGDVYSYGSWSMTASPTYRKRYKYSGGLTISFANTRLGDPSVKQEFVNSKDFHVMWNHSMDSKARPGINFGASVNFGTSSYNQYNVYDYSTRVNNNIGSSISFSKTWQNKPYNLTVSLSDNQNLQTRDVSLTFPDANFSVQTIYPFQPKEVIGTPKWYQKVGISYTNQFRNQAYFKDSVFGKQAMFDALQTGMQQTVPISFSIPVMKAFTLSPGITFNEYWYTKKITKQFNPNKFNYGTQTNGALDTIYTPGFYALHDLNTSLTLATALYGMYDFGANSKIRKIRHVMRPSIGMSFRPDLSAGAYYNMVYDAQGNTARTSYFQGSVIGVPSEGTFGGINFGLDNNLEMKVYSKKDTSANHEKKVKLLDGFGFNFNYNFIQDSFKLSPISLYARTNLFDKLNISASGTLDPYVIDAAGIRHDKYVWNEGKISPGRLTNASVTMSTSFTSKDKKAQSKLKELDSLQNAQDPTMLQAAQQRQLQQIRNHPGEYVDFDIPWRLDLSYALSYTNQVLPDSGGFVKRITQYVNFNGDFSLTPKWKIGMNSGFDFTNMKIAYTNMYISRDLHCWQMSINLVPFGQLRQFSITINPKAGILRDLRINRSRQFYDM